MRVLVFDLIGKMAHYRKYYTNSSSLSYFFPPRTTITGLIAGISGFERDSYYEIFSPKCSNIGISIKSPLRKILQVVNYVWAENISQVNLSSRQHTQIPLEIVIPEDWNSSIKYRIYFAHSDKDLFEKVVETVLYEDLEFPPYLGISEFIGEIEPLGIFEAQEVGFKDPMEIDSILNLNLIEDKSISLEPYIGAIYVKEKMPYSFGKGRIIDDSPREFIGEIKGKRIRIRGEGIYYLINGEKILFMEG
ncbi:MAG: type I-B CRISPR-associated protein Cas5b [bacterium]